MMEVHQLPALSDNFAYVLREPRSGRVAAVDAPDAGVITRFLEGRGWGLDLLLSTHHHSDHVGGNLALASRFGCAIYGAARDARRIPGITRLLEPGEEFLLGEERVAVLATDGHTRGHISYWLPESRLLFSGDNIFSLGCGKLFEGTAEEMWDTLARLRALPDSTLVYGSHEYTLENAAFALRVEPGNEALQARVREAEAQRAAGRPTVPTTLASEKACNPFLRPESAELQRNVRAEGQALWRVFGATREAKDRFDRGGEI